MLLRRGMIQMSFELRWRGPHLIELCLVSVCVLKCRRVQEAVVV